MCAVSRYEVEYEEAKRKTKETLHPLKLELAEINDYVSGEIWGVL